MNMIYFFTGVLIYPLFTNFLHFKLNKFSSKEENLLFYLQLNDIKGKKKHSILCILFIILFSLFNIPFRLINICILLCYLYLLNDFNYNNINLNKLFLFSPDFYFANLKKSRLVNYRKIYKNDLVYDYIKSKYIIFWNNLNCVISSFLFILCSYFLYLNSNHNFIIILGFISYRVFSRSIEVILAFYFDIIDSKPKSVFLNSNKRIILATKSYFEIICNFSTLGIVATIVRIKYDNDLQYFNYFFQNFTKDLKLNNLENSSQVFQIIFNIFTKSFGITTFTNASTESLDGILQILTTLVLVLFALAGYLNNKGENKNENKCRNTCKKA